MKNNPLVSVVIPVYNAERFLRETVESVISQSYSNLEIIICDDGSTDSSLAVARELALSDPRIRVLSNEENEGISFTRNRIIGEASGDYFALLDADDICLPDKIERQIEWMEQHPMVDVCGTWASKMDAEGKSMGGAKIMPPVNNEEIQINLMFQNSIVQSSTLLRASMKEHFRYDGEFLVCEDYDIMERLSHFTEIHNIPKPLVRYRIHAGGISSTKAELLHRRRVAVIERRLKEFYVAEVAEGSASELTTSAGCATEVSFAEGGVADGLDAERRVAVANVADDVRALDYIGGFLPPEGGREELSKFSATLSHLIAHNREHRLYNDSLFIAFLWYRWFRYAFALKCYKEALFPEFFTLSPKVLFKLSRLLLRLIF